MNLIPDEENQVESLKNNKIDTKRQKLLWQVKWMDTEML